jgi:hypothetical protein
MPWSQPGLALSVPLPRFTTLGPGWQLTWLTHWTAGFHFCSISGATGPPPVMSVVNQRAFQTAELCRADMLEEVES